MVWQQSTGLIAALAVLTACSEGWAQQPSLAEVARREAERRKAVTTPGKVYTNTDLRSGLPLTTAATPQRAPEAGAQVAPAVSGTAVSPPPGGAPPRPSVEQPRDEAWWRKQMGDLQDQLNRSRLFGEALQSRINGLWADFTARDDPAQRAVIEKDRNDAISELDRVRSDVARGEQAIADLEEEARRAGVPAGWLR